MADRSTETTDAIAYGRRRDDAADDVERCRVLWHAARTHVGEAQRELRAATRAEMVAEADYRAAVAAYEAVR